MHQVHTTPGFIIETRSYKEADKILFIFTRDFGLIQATAQGIRLEKSKLRYHANALSFGTFSLVRGREFWRLTSAQEMQNVRSKIQNISTTQQLLARIALLMRRLLHGEEAHPQLFDVVEACARLLVSTPVLSDEESQALESLTVLRMLDALGYIGVSPELDARIRTEALSLPLLVVAAGKRVALNQHINKALRESQM